MKCHPTLAILLLALATGCAETDCHDSRTCPGAASAEADADTETPSSDTQLTDTPAAEDESEGMGGEPSDSSIRGTAANSSSADGGQSIGSEDERGDGGGADSGSQLGRDAGTVPDAGSSASAGGECEPDRKRECWEDELGNPLPELEGELVGSCRRGTQTCTAADEWGPCQDAVQPEPEDRCDVAGADDDCNGVANENCTCSGSETRECGKAVGNCELGTQTCNGGTWGDCEGDIEPAGRDSCAVAGDDADCDGTPNEDCACTEDAPEECDDGRSCTADVCNGGVCQNPISTGSCLIAGQCVTHGTTEPNNPCRFCDSQRQPSGWSDATPQVSCDDGLWCNGADTCDGSGVCVHEYPDGDRCSLSGPCALSTCNEQRDSCFETEGTECSSETELRCQNSTCGGDVQTRTNFGYCNGQSASCADIVPGTWTTTSNCGSSQKCDSPTYTCVDTLGCGSTWCDAQEGLCWTASLPAGRMTLADATTYCEDLVLAGRNNWRLPTSNELASSARGCDGTDGSLKSVDFRSTCRTTSDDLGYSNCTACLTSGGPTDGCYWPTELGTCPTGNANFWSTTAMPSLPGVYYYFQFRYSRFGAGGDTTEQLVQCVTTL